MFLRNGDVYLKALTALQPEIDVDSTSVLEVHDTHSPRSTCSSFSHDGLETKIRRW